MTDDFDAAQNRPRAWARRRTDQIMAAISQAFTDPDTMDGLYYAITDIIADAVKQRDVGMIRRIAGPPAILPPPPPPPPIPPSRDLLMKYIAHVSELHGQDFLVSFKKSSVAFTEAELTELFDLEATYAMRARKA
jgi:hypothetical protein